jgi:hypothetical protein
VAFQWTSASDITSFFLGVSTTATSLNQAPWGNLHAQNYSGTTTSATVTNLPTNNSQIFVRLWWQTGGGWQFADFPYTTASTTTP